MDIESKLIALVKSYEFLYKVDADFYRDTLKKEDTWNKIGEQLSLSGSKCKKKWKNLRDSYKRLKQRNAQKPASEDKEKVKTWRYEEQLRFLDNVQSFRKPTGSEQDCIQPASLSRFQSMDSSDTEDYSNIEIKDELIISDPITYITSSPPPPDTKIEIKEEIIVSDSVPIVASLLIPPTKKQKIDNCTIEYNTIKNDGGIFYVSLPQKQQEVGNCLQPSILENLIPNASKQTSGGLKIVAISSVSQPSPPQKKQMVDNCFQSSTLQTLTPNKAKQFLPQNQQKVGNCFQSSTFGNGKPNALKETLPQNVENCLGDSALRKGLQIVAISSDSKPPPQKKQLVDSFFQSRTISDTSNQFVEDSNSSSEDFQFSPVSYATSTPPTTPTLPLSKQEKQENPEIEVLYEKFEDFLESASSAVKELQEKSCNSTVILFESLAKKIVEANLTQPQISEIEHGVCMLVFTKLGKFMSENDPPKI